MTLPNGGAQSESGDLSFAWWLQKRGVPVVCFRLTANGEPDTRDPRWKRWEQTKAGTQSARNLRGYKPGDGVAMVGGTAQDGLDWDPRNDPDGGGRDWLRLHLNGTQPLWRQETPSGGVHAGIPSLGLPRSKPAQGVDYQGGLSESDPDGNTHRGLLFIKPTMRPEKILREDGTIQLGELRPYVPEIIRESANASEFSALRAAIEAGRDDEEGSSRERLSVLAHRIRSARSGNQRGGVLAYTGELEKLGVPRSVIPAVTESIGIPTLTRGKPWTEESIKGAMFRAGRIVPDATEEERADLEVIQSKDFRPASRRGTGMWHDFTELAAGQRTRPVPTIFPRADGQALFYAGREHTIYGETESGKDMYLSAIVKWCLENELSVMWTDFEEGDEVEIGSRLLNAGLSRSLITDRSWFRYATPATKTEAEACLRDVVKMGPDIAIWDGVTAAYGAYGWQVKENDSATAFHSHLVRPCLAAGIASVASDHVTKDGSGGRYAIGGVMKLNMVTGASYLLEADKPIVRGGKGASRLVLTKDRPGGVKPACERTRDAAMLYAGMLTVKSVGPGFGELSIEVAPPQPGNPGGVEPGADVPDWLMQKVWEVYAEAGDSGAARTSVRDAWEGKGKNKVLMATDKLLADGFLKEGPKATRGVRLVAVKPWEAGGEFSAGNG